MASPEELRQDLEAIQALYASAGFGERVRNALESLEQSLLESQADNPDLDYDDIADDIIDFSILAFGGCY